MNGFRDRGATKAGSWSVTADRGYELKTTVRVENSLGGASATSALTGTIG